MGKMISAGVCYTEKKRLDPNGRLFCNALRFNNIFSNVSLWMVGDLLNCGDMKTVALFVALATSFLMSASADEVLTGRPRIIDGDSLEINGQQIRLEGIDAPEPMQKCKDSGGDFYWCGQSATVALAVQIGRSNVVCKSASRDRYGRLLATCRKGDTNLNEWIVRRGWAIAYRRYSTRYIKTESQARITKQGLWSGKFIKPEQWRRGKRLEEGLQTVESRDSDPSRAEDGQ